MITAKEASLKASQNKEDRLSKQRKDVEFFINEAIKCAEYRITYFKQLDTEIIEELRENGFEVLMLWYNGDYQISWEED